MDWLSPDESGIGWTRDGVPYVGWEPSALAPAPAGSYALPPLTIAPGALDIFNLSAPLPSIASRPDYRAEPVAESFPPLFVRVTKPTWFSSAKGLPMEIDPISAGDPLVRLSLGQMGSVDPAGPYYGGVDPSYQVFNLSDWSQPSSSFERMFAAMRTPQFTFRLPPTPSAQAIMGTPPAPAARVSSLLLYGALALAVILLVKR